MTNRPKILIVDDDAQIRKMVTLFLERRGHTVLCASDGEEALRVVGTEVPDLVVTDVMMPKMDGIELARRLRGHPRTSAVPILMLSARKQEDALLAGYEAGADEYVAKPIQLSVLGAKIEALLRRRAAPTNDSRSPGHVVTFVHAKGGVGTSTLVANIAATAGRTPERAFIVDASLPLGDAATLLDLDQSRSIADLAEHGPDGIDASLLGQVALTHSSGVRVLASPSSPLDAERVTADIVRAAIEAARQISDVVYVDTSSDFTPPTLAAIDAASALIVATSPRVSAIRATRQLLAVLSRLGVPAARIRVALDHVTPHGIDGQAVQRALDVRELSIVPHSDLFWTASDEGRPVILAHPDSSASLSIRQLRADVDAMLTHGPRRADDRIAA